MGAVVSIRRRMDGWYSALTGLGTVRDKLESYLFKRAGRFEDQVLADMFHEDDVAAAVCELPAEHILRPGWQFKQTPDEVTQQLAEWTEQAHIAEKFFEALVWEAVYGGAAIFIGADDGRPVGEPLDLDSLQAIKFLSVLEKRELTPHRWYDDPTDEKYGQVAIWQLQVGTVPIGIGALQKQALPEHLAKLRERRTIEIHESRLVTFDGRLVTRSERQTNNGWGGSVLVRSMKAIKTFHLNWQAVSHIMQDASQGVFKLKDLTLMIAEGKRDALQTRMETVDMSRSVARAVVVDADSEDFTRQDSSFAGLPDLLDRTGTRLASSVRIPVTILMGISPAGLNATGESDVRNWYDQLDATRQKKLKPRLMYLYRAFLRSIRYDGPFDIEFNPLWQMTEKEESEIRSTNAGTDQQYVSAGVLTPEQVQAARWKNGKYQYRMDDIGGAASGEATKLYDLLQTQLGQRTGQEPEVKTEPKP